MKYSLALAIHMGSLMSFAIAGSVLDQSPSPAQEQPEQPSTCERVAPLPPWAASYRGRCWYICKEWPLRIQFEPEGIACGLVTVNNTRRVCKNGRCVKADSAASGQSEPKRLIPTQGSTSQQGSGIGNVLGAPSKQATEDTTSTRQKSSTSTGGGLLSRRQ